MRGERRPADQRGVRRDGGSDLNGSNYPQSIPVRFQCEGGSFEDGTLNIKLAVSGTAAAFSNEVFKTDKNDPASG